MTKRIESAFFDILKYIGEDAKRQGLECSHVGFRQMLDSALGGYKVKESSLFPNLFGNKDSGMVVIKDVDFMSMCEHHFLPFVGSVDIGYIPDAFVAGIGDFADTVKAFSCRLQIQERMTDQIAKATERLLRPKALVIRVRASHACIKVANYNIGDLTTTYVRGFDGDSAKDLMTFWNNVR